MAFIKVIRAKKNIRLFAEINACLSLFTGIVADDVQE